MLVGEVFVLGWSMTQGREGRRVQPSWLETRKCWEEAEEISLHRLGGAS